MKKLAKSFAIIALVSTMAIGVTEACFISGRVAATDNTFAAGVLELQINNGQGVTHAFSIANLKPGANDWTGQVVLKNNSKINGHLWLEIDNVRTNGNGALGNLVRASFRNVSNGNKYGGTVSIKASEGKKIDLFDLPANSYATLALYAVWPDGLPKTDNRAQGETTHFDVIFRLDQKM